jgi:hypothetical protein
MKSLPEKNLDDNWQFVGEVNRMRAYKQGFRAICFVKWEDFIQKMEKLPAWRVFAAASNKRELDGIKASLKAQWKDWGS